MWVTGPIQRSNRGSRSHDAMTDSDEDWHEDERMLKVQRADSCDWAGQYRGMATGGH